MSPLRGDFAYQPAEEGLPPQDVRIVELSAEPWHDSSHRVRVTLELTPFLQKPDIEVILASQDNVPVASINIVESIDPRMTFTMHIRSDALEDVYLLQAKVTYADQGTVDEKTISFETSVKED